MVLTGSGEREDNCGGVKLCLVDSLWWREESDARSWRNHGIMAAGGRKWGGEGRKWGIDRAGLMTDCLSIYIIIELGSDSL